MESVMQRTLQAGKELQKDASLMSFRSLMRRAQMQLL